LLRQLRRLQRDNLREAGGRRRQIAKVTHTNTITTSYKNGEPPEVESSSASFAL